MNIAKRSNHEMWRSYAKTFPHPLLLLGVPGTFHWGKGE